MKLKQTLLRLGVCIPVASSVFAVIVGSYLLLASSSLLAAIGLALAGINLHLRIKLWRNDWRAVLYEEYRESVIDYNGNRIPRRETYRYREALLDGHWYTDRNRELLFIVPDDRIALAVVTGPDDARLDALRQYYEDNLFENVDRESVAARLGLVPVDVFEKNIDGDGNFFIERQKPLGEDWLDDAILT